MPAQEILPSNIAKESKQDDIIALQQEVKNLADSVNTLVAFLYANSPRIDGFNRLVTTGAETTQPISGTVTATVTTVATVTNQTNIGGFGAHNITLDVPLHIYDKIGVS